jgi:hypothetical protein
MDLRQTDQKAREGRELHVMSGLPENGRAIYDNALSGGVNRGAVEAPERSVRLSAQMI